MFETCIAISLTVRRLLCAIMLLGLGPTAWADQGRGSLHIYGHSHGNLEGFGRSMYVGWDAWGRYLLLEEVIDRLESKEIEVADHHKIIVG